jgi:ethanolaminephosphotransferase
MLLAAGLGIAFNTLDNVDGKLARRRGMGSALGQIMDHGCDGMFCGLGLGTVAFTLNLSQPFMFFWWLMGSLQWIGVAWEEHHTGVLRMDYLAADETEYAACLLAAFTGMYGFGVWSSTHYLEAATAVLPTSVGSAIHSMCATDAELLAVCIFGCNLLAVHSNLCQVKRAIAPEGLRGWWSKKFLGSLRDLLPFFIYCSGCLYWSLQLGKILDAYSSQTSFFFAISGGFARMALELVHCTLTKLQYPQLFLEMLLPLFGVILAAYFPELSADFLHASAVVMMAAYVQHMVSTAVAYADALNVNVLMPPQYDAHGKAIQIKPE